MAAPGSKASAAWSYEAVRRAPQSDAFVVSASRLTGRKWNGSLRVYADAAALASDLPTTAVETVSGTPDVQWVDGRRLVTGSDNGSVSLWEWHGDNTVGFVHSYIGHDAPVSSVSVGDGRVLSASHDSTIHEWDAREEGPSLATYRGHTAAVHCVARRPGHLHAFASVGADGKCVHWDTRTAPKSVHTQELPSAAHVITWHPSENIFALGHVDGAISVHDARHDTPGVVLAAFAAHAGLVAALDWTNADSLLSGSDDRSVALHDWKHGGVRVRWNQAHEDFVRGVIWGSAQEVFSVGWDGAVGVHVFE